MASSKTAAGKKRITINDIAQMAGTSKTTVSFYLNGKTDRMSEETQKRIRLAIDETGYQPSPLARGMNAKQSNLIGVIIGDITNTFSNLIVKGIESVIDDEGYRMLVCSSNFDKKNELAYIDRLLAIGVDGFIVQPTAQFREVSKSILDAGKQLVFIDSKLYDHASSWVKTDNYESSYQAVDQCIHKGYERFIVVTAEPGLISSRIERFSGFVDALEAHGFGFSQFILENDRVDPEALKAYLVEQIVSAGYPPHRSPKRRSIAAWHAASHRSMPTWMPSAPSSPGPLPRAWSIPLSRTSNGPTASGPACCGSPTR